MTLSPNHPARFALRRLEDGNARFSQQRSTLDLRRTPLKMKELAEKGQVPIASVLACSDSRVPVEMLFDCDLGDLFVVRGAGNTVAEPAVAGVASLEYAVAYLHTPLVVILGHTGCGAVQAAVDKPAVDASPYLAGLLASIQPAVKAARIAAPDAEGKELLRAVELANVRYQREALLQRSVLIREAVRSERAIVVGALYDISTGTVKIDSGVPAEAAAR